MTLEIDILCMFIDLVTFYSAQTTGQHHVECIHSLKHTEYQQQSIFLASINPDESVHLFIYYKYTAYCIFSMQSIVLLPAFIGHRYKIWLYCQVKMANQ